MVVKMMKWRPWDPLSGEKFEVKIVVQQLKGLNFSLEDGINDDKSGVLEEEYGKMAVQIKWKGSKGSSALSLGSLRKSITVNFTKEGCLIEEDGVIQWNEEFFSVCNFVSYKDGTFYPWEVTFTVFNGSNKGRNEKVAVLFTGLLNLANLSYNGNLKDIEVCLPLRIPKSSNNENKLILCLSVSLLPLTNTQKPSEIAGPLVPIPHSPRSKDNVPLLCGKDEHPPVILCQQYKGKHTELPSVKANVGKGSTLRAISNKNPKKESCEDESSDGKSSVRSEDTDNVYALDTESYDDLDEDEEESDTESFTYESLARANNAGQVFDNCSKRSEEEGLIYYSHYNRKDSGKCYIEDSSTSDVVNKSSIHGPVSSMLPWRKRKLSFKPFKEKGEPLLKKQYEDDGGDDIDHDRRLLSSSDESTLELPKGEVEDAISVSEFGDDSFAVGSWEQKDIFSRDGNLKLQTQVFFASIDQRNEQAAGASACTALVAVIADWFQSNPAQMPIKSQLDSLIRDGSLQWRNLCDNEMYKERFSDKHFDLETVLMADKTRSLSVVPEKSFIGFFHPEGFEDEGFEFLEGVMSFDDIWDEISGSVPDGFLNSDPLVYIVSWNDHFFILKVEKDAFFIIDSLGERLFEGCNKAFILKFDRDTTISKETTEADNAKKTDMIEANVARKEEESNLLCRGKESCKDYIKNFLAAIPVRQLQVDIKKGLIESNLIHQRLQIEFHYTTSLKTVPESYSA